MNFKVGDVICIEGQFVQITTRKPWCGISGFQLNEWLVDNVKQPYSIDFAKIDAEEEIRIQCQS